MSRSSPLQDSRAHAYEWSRLTIPIWGLLAHDGLMAKKILVIDDEADVRSFVALMLAAQGADVREASGGHEGVLIADEFHPDVVVMDFMMPEMSGAQAAAAIRAALPLTQIVGFSAFDQRFPWADHQVSKGPHAYEELTAAVSAA